jgi:hypothetical protein
MKLPFSTLIIVIGILVLLFAAEKLFSLRQSREPLLARLFINATVSALAFVVAGYPAFYSACPELGVGTTLRTDSFLAGFLGAVHHWFSVARPNFLLLARAKPQTSAALALPRCPPYRPRSGCIDGFSLSFWRGAAVHPFSCPAGKPVRDFVCDLRYLRSCISGQHALPMALT